MTPDAERWIALHQALAVGTAAADGRYELLDEDGLLTCWRPGEVHVLYALRPTGALPAALTALPDLRWVWVRAEDAASAAPVLRSLGWVPWHDEVLAMLLDDESALAALEARALPHGISALDVDRPDRLPLLGQALREGFALPWAAADELADEVSLVATERVAVDATGWPLAAARAQAAGPDAVHVQRVCTVPAARRRGLAAALVGGLLRDLGAREAVLAGGPDGVAAWQALGFRTVDTWTTWQRAPG